MLGLPRALWGLILIGAVVRLVMAFATFGVAFDIESIEIIRREVATGNLFEVYGNANIPAASGDVEVLRWPYPPGFFPWIGISAALDNLTPLPFDGLIQLMPIAADLGIGVAVFIYLGWKGFDERTRLLGVAMVLLGPSFIAISGYAVQIDSVAILPAVLGLMMFERMQGRSREIVAGLLVGVGIAIKWIPGFLLAALVPAAGRVTRALLLVGAAAAVPVLTLAPFFLADPDGVLEVLDYRGAPGLGGLGMIVQPSLLELWMTERGVFTLNAVSEVLYDHASKFTVLALAGLMAFGYRYRPPVIEMAVLVWLIVYCVAPNFFFQYLVWGLPFFLMAGYIWQVAAMQIVALGPTLIAYAVRPVDDATAVMAVYFPLMALLWLGWVAAAVLIVRRIVRGPSRIGGGLGERLIARPAAAQTE